MVLLLTGIQKLVDVQTKWNTITNKIRPLNFLVEQFTSINKNPVLQFALVSTAQYLVITDSNSNVPLDKVELDRIEEILDENLLPYLELCNLDKLWLGAIKVFNSKSNPDNLRHCLVSLRTLLEHTIEKILAPNEVLRDVEQFKNCFKNYYTGKIGIDEVKIPRKMRIDFIFSQYDIPLLDDSIAEDVTFITKTYKTLCNLHQLDVNLTPLDVRKLMVKTGVIIWLLVHLHNL